MNSLNELLSESYMHNATKSQQQNCLLNASVYRPRYQIPKYEPYLMPSK